MKPFRALILATVLLAPLAAFAANPFEGRISFKLDGDNGPQSMTYSVKGGFSRIEIPVKGAGTPAVIMDTARKEMTILMPEQKMYMVRPIPASGASADLDGNAGPVSAEDVPTFEKTGVTEKILGYTCEQYTAKSKNSVTTLWVTDQLGSFTGFGPGGGSAGGAAQGWEAALAGKNFFPLRVKSTGRQKLNLEATGIEKKSLPDSDFTPPADWQKFDMGAMMRGLLPGGR